MQIDNSTFFTCKLSSVHAINAIIQECPQKTIFCANITGIPLGLNSDQLPMLHAKEIQRHCTGKFRTLFEVLGDQGEGNS